MTRSGEAGLVFLAGGGDMGERVRAADWAAGPLGPAQGWPQSLKTAVSLMLNSGHPMFVAWGPELVFLYNDAYAPILGTKHPESLGRPFQAIWSEIWADIHPLIARALAGEATWSEDLYLVMERNGYPEDTWYTFSYSPVRDESGAVGGMFCACTETTAKVLGERRLRAGEERLQLIQAAGGVGSFDWDMRTGAIFRSAEYLAIQGLPADTPLDGSYSDAWVDRLHPEDRERVRAGFLDDIARPGPFEREYRIIRADTGETRWILNRGRVEGDDSGRPVRLLSAQTDITARKLAEQALRDSEERLRLAQEAAGAGSFDWDLTNGEAVFSPEYLRIMGFREDERPTAEMLLARAHPEERARLSGELEAVRDGRKLTVSETRIVLPDGRVRWVQSHARTWFDADDRPVRRTGVIQDVTERREAEAALQESEARFRNMADHAPVMMWVTDPTGWCVYLNRSWYDFTGQSPEEAEGLGWLHAAHPDDRARAEAAFNEATERRQPFRLEYRLRRADGLYRWAIDAAAPRFSAEGRFLGFVGSVIDIDERREAEDQLRLSEQRFRAAVDAVQGVLWTNDAQGQMLGEQPGWAALTGQSETEYRGYGWTKAVHPADAEPTVEAWNQAVAERRMFVFEHRVRRFDGVWRMFSVRAIPLFDTAGEVREWVGVHTDITEAREAELRLRESEENYRHAAELNPQVAWTAQPDGQLDRVAERWREWTGASGLGDTWGQGLHPDDLQPSIDAWTASVTTGVPYDIEHRVKRVDGSYRWAHSRAYPRRDDQGDIVRWYGTTEDIHERKLAEAALRESETRFRLMADHAPALIWATDAEGRLTFANRRYETELGLPVEQVLNEGWSRSVHPDDADRLFRSFSAAFARRELFAVETRSLDKSGRLRWLRSEAVPRFDGSGEFVGYVGCSVDITEARLARDALEAEVEARTAELRAAEAGLRQAQKMEAVGQLTGGIAHDFNNLLTAVVGGLDIIKRRTEDDRTRKLAGNALEAAERGVKLTGQLLAFSRTQRLAVEPVNMNALITGMRELIASAVGGHAVVRMELDPAVGAALTDANQCELAILNLCINARDALPEGGTIVVSSALESVRGGGSSSLKPGRYVVVSVADDGQGMDPEVQERAFDPFFTTKGVGRGTGLGLSQVYGTALQSGGEARLESEPGRGTTVRLYLPVADGTAQAPQSTSSDDEAAPANGDRRLVLVVDDDPDVRRFVVDSLDALGFRVLEAADGPSGLALFDRTAPDVLLLDFAMPGMTGAEVAEVARRTRPEQPIVFASGYADTAALERAAGDAVVLRKPFRMADLGAALERALSL